MPRDYKLYLEDILLAIGRIRRSTDGITFEQFTENEEKADAVVRNLEVIGEAIKRLPEDVRTSRPDIEWKRIAGLRDILIHDYFGIDLKIIWDVVEHKLTQLDVCVRELLK
jgi:uncharacterized protein with HEPN domain